MRPADKVLNGIDLTIEGGTTVAFVGAIKKRLFCAILYY
jgi:ABC-type multidrug transport system fused ATPase/permease subunit